MNKNPVMFWHYWCAAVLSAHCRRIGSIDPIENLTDPDVEPRSFLPAIAALPHPIKAACIKNARHWCRRLLRQGGGEGITQILDGLTVIATNKEDLRALGKTGRGALFYALRAGQWKIMPRIMLQLCLPTRVSQ